MTRSRPISAAFAALCLGAVLVSEPAGAGLAAKADDACDEIDRLKSRYLACERAAQTGRLGPGETARCSDTYYELKTRAFDGDFGRLRAWYDRMVTMGVLDGQTTPAASSGAGTSNCG
jgi:hypothetical protein